MLYNDAYRQFLNELDMQTNKEIYARVTALTFDELPLETIEGRITGGSINIDGTSAVRRSCSLTIAAQDFKYNDYYWGLKSKIKLEIGVKNTISSLMPSIIWFNQGIYVLTTFNTSYNTNNATISINAKDKMCLLNGDIGGTLESSVDFGTIEEEDNNGVWKINKIPIADIIRNMVHTYAGEPFHNIIINDLENYGLELLEYRYDVPMYLYREESDKTNSYHNMIMENDDLTLYLKKSTSSPIKLKDLTTEYLDILVDLPGGEVHNPKPVYFKKGSNSYVAYIFTKIEYGQTAGYRVSDLIYPGDLVANAGESITSVLDKIRNMLTEFEYFYDLDGHFVFQKKQSFIATMWSSGEDANSVGQVEQSKARNTANAYIFKDNQIITAMSNNPNLMNLRNDYSIWGERTGTSGAKLPIHMRYAIDKKPTYYKAFDGTIYATGKDVFQKIEYTTLQQIFSQYFDDIKGFKLAHGTPPELTAPIQMADGSWTPGWWDIRDWAAFYKLLTATTEDPPYTMKWYSTGDETGYQWVTVPNLMGTTWSGYAWLLIYYYTSNFAHTKGYATGHGASQSISGSTSTCTLHYSYYRPDGSIATDIYEDADGNPVTKEYTDPYRGCTDTHTYLKFLTEDTVPGAKSVYFYNPDFPSHDSYEQLVTEVSIKYYEAIGKIKYVDWREIIYQMGLDYYEHNTSDTFELDIIANNPIFYSTGQTGYERYYIDLQGFWRQLYNPTLAIDIADKEMDKIIAQNNIDNLKSNISTLQASIKDYNERRESLTADELTALNKAVIDLKSAEEALRLAEIELDKIKLKLNKYYDTIPDYYYYNLPKDDLIITYKGIVSSRAALDTIDNAQEGDCYFLSNDSEDKVDLKGDIYMLIIDKEKNPTWQKINNTDNKTYWLRDVYEHPESLNFWFDFLDTEGQLQQFNVKNIGSRSKTVNETTIKSIYFRETPAVVFTDMLNTERKLASYKHLQIPEAHIEQMFSISAQGKSAKDRLDELIYAHGYCTETISVTALPIYYLDVNTRIYIHNDDNEINGDYIVSKITLPLTYNGTMSINATKAAENILY